MKKVLFFLLFSVFCFGQNIEFLKKANSDLEGVKFFSNTIFSTLNKIDSVQSKDKAYRIVYLPKEATEKEAEDYQIGNSCKRCASSKYMKTDSGFYFLEATGDFETLFKFWQSFVEPNAEIKQEPRPIYFYKSPENKLWFNFWKTDGGHWMIKNMSNRF